MGNGPSCGEIESEPMPTTYQLRLSELIPYKNVLMNTAHRIRILSTNYIIGLTSNGHPKIYYFNEFRTAEPGFNSLASHLNCTLPISNDLFILLNQNDTNTIDILINNS